MAEIVSGSKNIDPHHDCQDELPFQCSYPSIDKTVRDFGTNWTVARCSCGKLWTAHPYVGGQKWKKSGPWAKFKYRNKGRQVPA